MLWIIVIVKDRPMYHIFAQNCVYHKYLLKKIRLIIYNPRNVLLNFLKKLFNFRVFLALDLNLKNIYFLQFLYCLTFILYLVNNY